ncbi:heme-copper oxidase subunit III [Pseudomonas sp. gcc21]|nr:heme-copper oxidase subunit III [Pseudomonas sp. gcc21]
MDVRERFVIDVGDFSRFNPGRQAPVWWGILGLVVIEATVLMAFVATYFYLRLMAPTWPPEGVEPPPLLLPSISVALLLGSSMTMQWGSKCIENEQYNRFVIAMFASVGLACTVLMLRWQQFQELGMRWDEHVYGSIVWTITGFHFVHLISAAAGTLVVGILGIKRYFNPQQKIGVVVDTLYWNFVSLVWIPLYLVVYWVPRWL